MPTFGCDTLLPDISGNAENYINTSKYLCPTAGIGDYIECWMTITTAAKNNKCALYTHDAGNNEPDDLVTNGVTEEVLVPTQSEVKTRFNFTGTKPRLEANTYYWISLFCGAGDGGNYFYADAATGYQHDYLSKVYNDFPANFGVPSGTYANLKVSFSCTYTEYANETMTLTGDMAMMGDVTCKV